MILHELFNTAHAAEENYKAELFYFIIIWIHTDNQLQ